MPPAAGTPTGFLTGRVRDIDTSDPAENVIVSFGGHASGFPNDYAATTGPDGRYRIDGIFAGTYPKVSAGGNGWDRQVRAALSISSGANTANWAVRRDWAALAGGASVTDTNDDTRCAVRLRCRGDVRPVAGQRLERASGGSTERRASRSVSSSWSCRGRST